VQSVAHANYQRFDAELQLLRNQSPQNPRKVTLTKQELKAIAELDELQLGVTDNEYKKLLKQRHNAAVMDHKLAQAMWQSGEMTFDNLADSIQRVLLAKLEFGDDDALKIQISEMHFATAKSVGKLIEVQYKAGVESMQVLAQAKQQRYDAEIRLLRSKRKAKP
jgi:hypothetical protein